MCDVSVIVPAHNAAGTIGPTLRALAAQAFGGRYEVIVVDDASGDDTGAIAQAAGARVVRNDPGLGAAGARNRGVQEARGAVLAFTDADCEPAPDWLAMGTACIDAGADLVQGAVEPLPGVPLGPWDRTLVVSGERGLYETANLFVRRATFDAAGGFPSFVAGAAAVGRGLGPKVGESPFGEDTTFGWRARRTGARTAFAAEALVHHAVFPRGARGYVRERWRARFFPTMVRENPELRGLFFAGTFLTPRRAAFDLAAAGA
ncbi:MAG: glycosyl transferase family 2, partial [Solirubrobacteraceae bacterium]|nr:glycosyl transferase family 2 [Solirubrobacteraceae bacterium]